MESKSLVDTQAAALRQAVGYFEGTLQEAIKEVHVDIGALKREVEKRIEEMLNLLSPVSQTLNNLQLENQELRDQVRRLSHQVEHLTTTVSGSGSQGPGERAESGLQPPDVTTLRAPYHTSSTRTNPDEQTAEQNGTDGGKLTKVSAEMNTLHSTRGKELTAARQVPAVALREHEPAALGLAHLPITAVTKSGEKFSAEMSTSSTSRSENLNQLAAGRHQTEGVSQTVNQADKTVSACKTVSSASYSMSGDVHSPSSVLNLYPDPATKSRSPPPTQPRQGEKRPVLMRSQTLPRTSGTQSRKALFEKFEHEGTRGKVGASKGKLQRSQSFGVASASSIKQILLEWCRSKTIGYKLIDIQNFSSSWSNGMAFCALVHSFFPEAFDYNELSPSNRKQNFELAFGTAEKMAHCDRLIEVEDMMVMGHKPDPMCVFTYVQSLYNHLRRYE
ncbi:smoothelin, like [Scyliorhinus canicula]|uniref:smoothelin, like n=1 Tax=Scyliorhinus canicula TaxID=7830 RepID=UPI0018F64853|nr:smoothelin, like [Scyliorhinus canicula]XP_038670670.1 smoothelin, like [Scyliorhinus canicula]